MGSVVGEGSGVDVGSGVGVRLGSGVEVGSGSTVVVGEGVAGTGVGPVTSAEVEHAAARMTADAAATTIATCSPGEYRTLEETTYN